MKSPLEKGKNLCGHQLQNKLAVLLCICVLLVTPILVSLVSSAPVRAASLTLGPGSGSFGTVITVTGSDFPADTDGWVWFDSDRDSTRDDEEPQMEVTTTSTGHLLPGTTLTVPELTTGSYFVFADIPEGIDKIPPELRELLEVG